LAPCLLSSACRLSILLTFPVPCGIPPFSTTCLPHALAESRRCRNNRLRDGKFNEQKVQHVDIVLVPSVVVSLCRVVVPGCCAGWLCRVRFILSS
jgi:hypothetical protein